MPFARSPRPYCNPPISFVFNGGLAVSLGDLPLTLLAPDISSSLLNQHPTSIKVLNLHVRAKMLNQRAFFHQSQHDRHQRSLYFLLISPNSLSEPPYDVCPCEHKDVLLDSCGCFTASNNFPMSSPLVYYQSLSTKRCFLAFRTS